MMSHRQERLLAGGLQVCAPAAVPGSIRNQSLLRRRPGAGGEANRDGFEAAMRTVDVTFQNLDSSEISLTDVSHYFDSDPTKLVAGLRGDGRTPSSYIADTTTANAQARALGAF